jgi:site-specific recombinase XerD
MARRPASEPRTITIDRAAVSWELALRAERKSDKTLYSYLLSVRLLREYLQRHDLPVTVDVSRDAIRGFLDEQGTPRVITDSLGRTHKGGSPATAAVRHKSLRVFFGFVVAEGELDRSPMDGMSGVEVKIAPVPVVNDETLTKLLKVRDGKSLADRRCTALLRVFLDTGCRLAEVTGLRQGDVDLPLRRLTVLGKGGHVRTVAISPKTARALDQYLKALTREQPARIGDDRHLWVGRQGPLTTSGITDALHSMCHDAGVPKLHWHQLRHTAAHQAAKAGLGDSDMMRHFGWRSREMVTRYGASAADERAQEAVERLALGDRV